MLREVSKQPFSENFFVVLSTILNRYFPHRKSVLEELTQNVHAEISDIESNLAELKK